MRNIKAWACLLVLPAILTLTMGFMTNLSERKKWLVSENSTLSVNGSTNVNHFSCEIPSCDQTDTLTITKKDKTIILSGSIGLSIQSFDCHNSVMTHDLRKTLKEKQFPKLRIIFLSLSSFPELTPRPQLITGMVNIELVGVTKRFEVHYQVSTDDQKVIHLVGSRDINFSDFNLVPPRKLGGLIKTNDMLSVIFHLNMKAIE